MYVNPSGESVIGEHDTIEAEPGSSARYEVCYVEAVVFFAPILHEVVRMWIICFSVGSCEAGLQDKAAAVV